jgi:hypothetical protein
VRTVVVQIEVLHDTLRDEGKDIRVEVRSVEAEGDHSQLQPELDGIRSVPQLKVEERTHRDAAFKDVEGIRRDTQAEGECRDPNSTCVSISFTIARKPHRGTHIQDVH